MLDWDKVKNHPTIYGASNFWPKVTNVTPSEDDKEKAKKFLKGFKHLMKYHKHVLVASIDESGSPIMEVMNLKNGIISMRMKSFYWEEVENNNA